MKRYLFIFGVVVFIHQYQGIKYLHRRPTADGVVSRGDDPNTSRLSI